MTSWLSSSSSGSIVLAVAAAIVFCSVGESSTSEGYYYEAVNGASRERLPVVFVVQDNGYGIPAADQSGWVAAR